MRSDRELVAELEQDLRLSPSGKVLYFEGRTDVPVFLGLLGQPLPETIQTEGLAVDGIWIRGLGARHGSGGRAVRARVRIAHERGYGSIRGLVDGDGKDYDTLMPGFEAPADGEAHRWPTYCIESWLPQSGWPEDWGTEPDWHAVLDGYLPYAALNRVVARVQQDLSTLGIARFAHPAPGLLETLAQVRERLGATETPSLTTAALIEAFDAEVERCRSALAQSLAHAHALVNGKWLVDHHAQGMTGKNSEHCRRHWSSHVAALGGQPLVRAWWDRFVAS